MKRLTFYLLAILAINSCKSTSNTTQNNVDYYKDLEVSVKMPDNVVLYGTLTMPIGVNNPPIVLIIAGSGPTDRNGNQPKMQSNIYKILADSLARHGIASVRYDKRGIGKSKVKNLDESKLTFEIYAEDAAHWIRWIKNQHHFSQIIIAGHSEGSLLGILAAQKDSIDKFISLEGAGLPIDEVLREQLMTQPKSIQKVALPILDSLKNGKRVQQVPPKIYSLFRPSIQPYLISWMQYDPAEEITKLKIPILIIHGTTDIQVPIYNAQILAKANPNAQLEIIKGMNHVLRKAPANRIANIKTYTKPQLPIKYELVKSMVQFIKSN